MLPAVYIYRLVS